MDRQKCESHTALSRTAVYAVPFKGLRRKVTDV